VAVDVCSIINCPGKKLQRNVEKGEEDLKLQQVCSEKREPALSDGYPAFIFYGNIGEEIGSNRKRLVGAVIQGVVSSLTPMAAEK
jgi:hypothetical protein